MAPALAIAAGAAGMAGFVAACASRLEGWVFLAAIGVSLLLYAMAFVRNPRQRR